MTMPSSKHLLVLLVVLLFTSINHVNGAKKEQELSIEVLEAEAAVHAERSSALMGKVFPLFSKLFVRNQKRKGVSFHQVVEAISDLVDERELAVFATVGWGLVPITQNLYECYANARGLCIESDGEEAEAEPSDTPKKSKIRETYEDITPWDDEKLKDRIQGVMGRASSSEVTTKEKPKIRPFRKTRLFHVVDHISQASKIGLSVIAVDCITLISRMMGYNPWNIMESVSRIYSQVVYSGWITYRLQKMKRFLLERSLRKKSLDSDLGKLNVIDNLADGVMGLIWMFYILNYLEVQTGVAVKSIFSLGATGTLIFGLASKDIATQIMSGLTLHLSDKIFEGDDVRFSDGTSGKIEKMGWFETMIRNSDELVVGIPNTQLSGQRVYNLSRTPRSQVKQTLRISYNDADKIPKLLENIKEEIKKDCPKLITDGSRPFRAHWRDYEDDHLQIVVDCHFKIKPTGNEYWDNRQRVLEAIFKAAKRSGVQFETLIRAIKV